MPEETQKSLWIKIDPTTGQKYIIVDENNHPIECTVCPCEDCNGVKVTITVIADGFPSCEGGLSAELRGSVVIRYIPTNTLDAPMQVTVVSKEPVSEGPWETLTSLAAGTHTWTIGVTGGTFNVPLVYSVAIPSCTTDEPLGTTVELCLEVTEAQLASGTICQDIEDLSIAGPFQCTSCPDEPYTDPCLNGGTLCTYRFYLYMRKVVEPTAEETTPKEEWVLYPNSWHDAEKITAGGVRTWQTTTWAGDFGYTDYDVSGGIIQMLPDAGIQILGPLRTNTYGGVGRFQYMEYIDDEWTLAGDAATYYQLFMEGVFQFMWRLFAAEDPQIPSTLPSDYDPPEPTQVYITGSVFGSLPNCEAEERSLQGHVYPVRALQKIRNSAIPEEFE